MFKNIDFSKIPRCLGYINTNYGKGLILRILEILFLYVSSSNIIKENKYKIVDKGK